MVEQLGAPRTAGPREWAGLSVLILAVTLLAIDGTVLALAVPSLTADLNANTSQVLWIGDIYSFALAGLLVTMGNLADRVGRKRLLLIGSVGFAVSSGLAALAPTPEILIAARLLLGISGATIMPSTLSIIRQLFDDPSQRTRAIAIWSAGATGGAAIGPLVGGLLLEHFWWGSVFLINVPVVAIIVVAGTVLLPESRSVSRSRIDVVSALLSFATIVPVVYAIKHTVANGFGPLTLLLVGVGVGAGYWFVRRQRSIPEPLIDVGLFRSPAFTGAVASNALAIFAMVGLLYFFSLYLQLVRGFGPLQAGVAELPLTIAAIVVVALIGPIATRLGLGPAIALGLTVGAFGFVLLAFAEALSGFTVMAIALVIIGLGVGITMTLSVDAVVTAVPKDRAGAASSLSETAYELGIALGIAVLGSLQALFYRRNLEFDDSMDDETREAVTESLAGATKVLDGQGPAAADALQQAQHAFTSGMQVTTGIAAALLLAAAVLASLVIPNTKPDKRRANH